MNKTDLIARINLEELTPDLKNDLLEHVNQYGEEVSTAELADLQKTLEALQTQEIMSAEVFESMADDIDHMLEVIDANDEAHTQRQVQTMKTGLEHIQALVE